MWFNCLTSKGNHTEEITMNTTFTATGTNGQTATGSTPTAAVKAARKAGIETSLVVTETATGTQVYTTSANFTGEDVWTTGSQTRSN